jgi:hypothetical protein
MLVINVISFFMSQIDVRFFAVNYVFNVAKLLMQFLNCPLLSVT